MPLRHRTVVVLGTLSTLDPFIRAALSEGPVLSAYLYLQLGHVRLKPPRSQLHFLRLKQKP